MADETPENWKTILQEHTRRLYNKIPTYSAKFRNLSWVATAHLKGFPDTHSSPHRQKKAAEQEAAELLYKTLTEEKEDVEASRKLAGKKPVRRFAGKRPAAESAPQQEPPADDESKSPVNPFQALLGSMLGGNGNDLMGMLGPLMQNMMRGASGNADNAPVAVTPVLPTRASPFEESSAQPTTVPLRQPAAEPSAMEPPTKPAVRSSPPAGLPAGSSPLANLFSGMNMPTDFFSTITPYQGGTPPGIPPGVRVIPLNASGPAGNGVIMSFSNVLDSDFLDYLRMMIRTGPDGHKFSYAPDKPAHVNIEFVSDRVSQYAPETVEVHQMAGPNARMDLKFYTATVYLTVTAMTVKAALSALFPTNTFLV